MRFGWGLKDVYAAWSEAPSLQLAPTLLNHKDLMETRAGVLRLVCLEPARSKGTALARGVYEG